MQTLTRQLASLVVEDNCTPVIPASKAANSKVLEVAYDFSNTPAILFSFPAFYNFFNNSQFGLGVVIFYK